MIKINLYSLQKYIGMKDNRVLSVRVSFVVQEKPLYCVLCGLSYN
jgi:hypothetical protein